MLNKTSPGAKKLLSRIALSVRRYLAGGAASAHLPLSRKCYFDVLSAAACDCEPQSHINSISRQTATDRRTDGCIWRGRWRRRSATRDFDDGNEEEDDNEDDGERGGVKKGHRRRTRAAAASRTAPRRGVEKGFRHRSANGNCGFCIYRTGDALSSSWRTPVTGDGGDAHRSVHFDSPFSHSSKPSPFPTKKKEQEVREERGIARARLLTPHPPPPPHPWLIPNCLAERNCIICVGSANCE